jgi:hypothetical protein
MEPLSLRELIARTIATRDPLEDWRGKPINWADISEGHRECYRRDADAILAIPGIAVVELPSFDSIEDDFRVVDNKVRHYLPNGFGAYRWYRLNEARDLAAALLAAADYAERDQ